MESLCDKGSVDLGAIDQGTAAALCLNSLTDFCVGLAGFYMVERRQVLDFWFPHEGFVSMFFFSSVSRPRTVN